jgi:hypothetical protein
MSSDENDRDMGRPDEVAAAYDQFRSGFRPRPPTHEEEAALGLAIELSEAETRAFIEENRETAMASEFPDELRETVLRDLAEVMAQAAGLHRSWQEDSEPGDLLTSARAVRDAALVLARSVEALWPNQPPSDYGSDLFGDR